MMTRSAVVRGAAGLAAGGQPRTDAAGGTAGGGGAGCGGGAVGKPHEHTAKEKAFQRKVGRQEHALIAAKEVTRRAAYQANEMETRAEEACKELEGGNGGR